MGYITNYEVTTTGFKDRDQAEFFEFKAYKLLPGIECVVLPTRVEFSLEAKWYNWLGDCEKLSLAFPEALIEVQGTGEENDDIWRARIKNGEHEIVKAEIHFPEFKNIIK